MNNRLPAPVELQSRWKVLTLLMDLSLGPSDIEQVRFEVTPNQGGFGLWNDFGGNYCWISCTPNGTLFYGVSEFDSDEWELRPSVERNARAQISRLSKEIQSLIKPMHPDSMGWTFAMWSPGPDEEWRDLTGRDKECWNSAQFPECEALFGDPEEVTRWAREQLERTDVDREVGQLARFEPLTKAMANALMEDVDLDLAHSAAIRAGYPLASSWIK